MSSFLIGALLSEAMQLGRELQDLPVREAVTVISIASHRAAGILIPGDLWLCRI